MTTASGEVQALAADLLPELQRSLAQIKLDASIDAMRVTVLAILIVILASLVISLFLPRTKIPR